MQICFTTDFHGRLGLYAQLTNLLHAEKPDLLILGGDMHAECEQSDPLGTQVAFVQRKLASMVAAWKTMIPKLEVACVLGNHDMACTQAAMRVHHRAHRLALLELQPAWEKGGLKWVGLSTTPPSPYWVKDLERLDMPGDPLPVIGGAVWDDQAHAAREVEASEHFNNHPTLAAELAAAPAITGPWVFVAHTPPHATHLDRLPNLDYPIGSRAVRQFIESRQPLLALHGHVHESPDTTGSYVERIGQTLCINPGQSNDRLYAVMLDTARPIQTVRHTVFG
jgi:uncharacterized protein